MLLVGGAVVLAAGGTAAAIKISSEDAKRIEEHTGMPASDLQDDDLDTAMKELGIQGQVLTAEDQAALAADEGASSAGSTPTAAPAQVVSETSYIEELEKLADLRDRDIISNEDFEAKKRQLLGI